MDRRDPRIAKAFAKSNRAAEDGQRHYLVAYDCHAKGDLDGAQSHYLRAFSADPEHPGVLLGLGLIAHKRLLLDEAEQFLRQAAKSAPQDANIVSNLTAVLLDKKDNEECVRLCHAALALDAKNHIALTNLSLALGRMSDPVNALDAAFRAIAIAPEYATAHNALAIASTMLSDTEPERLDQVLVTLARMRELNPSDQTIDYITAEVRIAQGRFKEAVAVLEPFATSHDADPTYYRLMAKAQFGAENYVLARVAAKKYSELDPESGLAHALLGMICQSQRQFDDALEAFKKAYVLLPDEDRLHLDICHLRQSIADWENLVEEQTQDVLSLLDKELFFPPFTLLSLPDPAGSAQNQLRCAQIYQRFVAGDYLTRVARTPNEPRRKLNKRLKIGYLSSDYKGHATSSLIAELIERHDRNDFEIIAYCYSFDDCSSIRNRLMAAFDQFVVIKDMSRDEAVEQIRNDGIDVLVDLKGFTEGSRTNILAGRPAPVQINFLGFPGTLGGEYIDYIIGDEFLTPFASEKNYAEKIVQLPNCYQPNDTSRPVGGHLMRRQDYGLPQDAFVFCSFNNLNKLNRNVFQIWMRLLHSVPNSVLWMLATTTTARTNLRREAAACSIDPDRLIFAAGEEVETHIARMRLADLFVDSFPCTGHTTASEALWSGVPILTCAGETFASRVAGSIVSAAELPELVTESLEDYEERALHLALNPKELARIRDKVSRAAASPLFDIATYTRDLERAYRHMASLYESGAEAQSFAVRNVANPERLDQPSKQPEVSNMQIAQKRADGAQAPDRGSDLHKRIDARIMYNACPLCQHDEISAVGESDCSRHPLYKPQLPPTIGWRLCHSCRHVFAEGFFNEEALMLLYPKTPAGELAGYDIERQRFGSSKIVQTVARVASPGVWLDVGFGNGSLLFSAQEWGYKPVGLDIRPDNVKAMQDFGIEAHELCIELYEPAEQCSVISMINVLQHLPFPGSAIAHAARLLKPNGVLHISAPNMDTVLWRMLDKEKVNPYWTNLELYHQFTRRRLYQMLTENGIVPIEYNINERVRSGMDVLAIKPA